MCEIVINPQPPPPTLPCLPRRSHHAGHAGWRALTLRGRAKMSARRFAIGAPPPASTHAFPPPPRRRVVPAWTCGSSHCLLSPITEHWNCHHQPAARPCGAFAARLHHPPLALRHSTGSHWLMPPPAVTGSAGLPSVPGAQGRAFLQLPQHASAAVRRSGRLRIVTRVASGPLCGLRRRIIIVASRS